MCAAAPRRVGPSWNRLVSGTRWERQCWGPRIPDSLLKSAVDRFATADISERARSHSSSTQRYDPRAVRLGGDPRPNPAGNPSETMQAIANVLLWGSLLTVVFVGPGCSAHEEPPAPGVLLAASPAEGAQKSGLPDVPKPSEPEPSSAASKANASPDAGSAAAANPAVSAANSGPTPKSPAAAALTAAGVANDPTFEAALASEIVHRPAGVANWLESHSKEVASSRAAVAKALVAAVLGAEAEARSALAALESSGSGTVEERDLVQQIIAGAEPRARPASSGASSILAEAARLALTERSGRKALERGRMREAAEAFSALLLAEVHSPWRSEPSSLQDWSEALRRAQSGWQWSRRGEWPGIEVKVEPGDSLIAAS